jgi:hypothetical protein
MKTKKQTEKQELKYAPGDKVVYHCAGVDREGLIAYVDDSDNVAPYRINGMNIREADIIEKVAKRRGRPAVKKQAEEKTEVVVNAEPKQKPEETQAVESIQEEEPDVEPTLVEKYQAFKSTINMAEFNDLVDLVTADTKKMRELMAKSMQSIANDCGLKA